MLTITFVIYIYKTLLVKVLFNTSEHNLSKSSYLIELTSVFKVKLFITSVIVGTMQDVQKKIDTKFKTLKLLKRTLLEFMNVTKRVYQ